MPEDTRTLKLLQPNLRVLYFIHSQKKVSNNISALSRELGYAGDGPVNSRIAELINKGYLEDDGEFLIVTRKGERLILPLILLKYFPFITGAFGLILFGWAVGQLFFNLEINWLTFLAMSILLFLFTAYLERAINDIKKALLTR
jgi:hypothetical protein